MKKFVNSLLKHCFLLSFVFFLFPLSAQDTSQNPRIIENDDFLGGYVSRIWTISDGLPGNSIIDLLQDSHGYMNIGTYAGLVLFDGLDFTIYNRDTDSRCDFVSARTLFLDSKGNMWVGANDEGISLISEDNQTVLTFTKKNGLPGNSIRSICEDNDGNIWVGTSAGVAYISPEHKVFIPHGLEQYNDENTNVKKLFKDSSGRVWLATDTAGGIYYYQNGKLLRYEGIKSIKKPSVTEISQESNGALWFGIAPHYAVKISDGAEKLYNLAFGEQFGTVVNSIYQDSKGYIWFAMDNGVLIMHDGVMSTYTVEKGLTDRNVNRIMEDREHNIWIATDRGGVQKLTVSRFKTVNLPTVVNSIVDDPKNGLVWIGADDGLYCYENSTLRPVKNAFTKYCEHVRIRHLAFTRDGSLLVSTYGKYGQLKFSPDGKIDAWLDELTGKKVRVALESSDGKKIYIGTTNGLNVVDCETGKVVRKYASVEDGIPNPYIMALYQAPDGNIWCGTDGGGIFVLDTAGNVVNVYTKEKDGLAGNVIFKISDMMENNEIWICTGSGLSRYKDKSFFTFNTASGLGTSDVFQAIEDYTGTVWFTSNRGISSVKRKEMEAFADGEISHLNTKFFGRSDGITSGGMTATSLSMKDYSGRLWFTLIDGFTIYDPVKVLGNFIAPYTEFTTVGIDGKNYSYKTLTAGGTLKLQPSNQRFSLNFTGLSFISPEQMKFKFMLEGFDSDFSEWSTTRSVSYTNLKPGTYTFYLRAQTSDGAESTEISSVKIIKLPYIWQLWYFWFIILLVFTGLVILVIMNRFHRMKRYQEALERTVETRTLELRKTNRDLEIEKNKSEALLLRVFPKKIAKVLSDSPDASVAESYPMVSVLFADIVEFTKLSSQMTASAVVTMLNELFSKFDTRAQNEGVEKIKTIGDSYMAACGLSEDDQSGYSDAVQLIKFAQGMLQDLEEYNKTHPYNIKIRIGINTGNLVAGVMGKTKFLYDVWGDTVNVACRMESSGLPGKIHVTDVTHNLTKDDFKYGECTVVEAKGKGKLKTYFI